MSFVKSLLCLRCVLKDVTRLCEYLLQQMFAHYALNSDNEGESKDVWTDQGGLNAYH